ncbi:MAG TPA: resolvase, partial [Xanthomarina gelatinilytica]|nr:resolvase [Xanthomarina gelatinilytica]
MNIVEDLQSKGIHLKCITEGIDTSTTTGKLFYQMNAIFAE